LELYPDLDEAARLATREMSVVPPPMALRIVLDFLHESD
jgi:hypothetical protein